MAEDVTSDILMYFIFKGSDPIEGESSTVNLLQRDTMTRDFKPGKFFEVSDFSFAIKLKDKETHKDKDKDKDKDKNQNQGELRSFARWRTMTTKQLAPKLAYKADIEDFSITRMIDSSSPVLMQYCMTREPFAKAVLVKRARGPSGLVLGFLRMEFSEVRIKSISWADGDAVRETCKFRYKAINVSYVRRRVDDAFTTPPLPCQWESTPNG